MSALYAHPPAERLQRVPSAANKKLCRSFVDAANWPAAAPFSENDFKRLDENDDAQFYPAQQPRLVYHIDEGAVAALTAYYKREIKPGAAQCINQLGGARPATAESWPPRH